jgi:hypothetical protein
MMSSAGGIAQVVEHLPRCSRPYVQPPSTLKKKNMLPNWSEAAATEGLYITSLLPWLQVSIVQEDDGSSEYGSTHE